MTRSRPTGISPRRCAPTPLRTGDGGDVGVNAVGMAGLAVTYDEELRAPFYEAIAQGQHGDGTLFALFAQGFVDELDLGPTFAVNCLDLPHPTTSADVEALAARAADAATVLPELSGAYVSAFALPCVHWPVPAPTALEPVTAAGSATDPGRRQHRRPGHALRVGRASRRHASATGISSPTRAPDTPHTARMTAPTPTSTRTCSTSRSLRNRPPVHDPSAGVTRLGPATWRNSGQRMGITISVMTLTNSWPAASHSCEWWCQWP